jgi:multicomponent Na+:H+ antiporter subunit E
MPESAAVKEKRRNGQRTILRLIFFGALWGVLTRGAGSSWIFGMPAILAAALLRFDRGPRITWRWRLKGALRFIPYFLWHSLRGGIDVSRRALHPRRPLDPALVFHPLRLPPGPARVFPANTFNLLPGTLSAELAQGWLTVHMLDARLTNVMELQRVEEQVAALFGVDLAGSGEDGDG